MTIVKITGPQRRLLKTIHTHNEVAAPTLTDMDHLLMPRLEQIGLIQRSSRDVVYFKLTDAGRAALGAK
jgi:hypothetical protein